MAGRLKWQIECYSPASLFNLVAQNESKLRIGGPLWECGTRFSISWPRHQYHQVILLYRFDDRTRESRLCSFICWAKYYLPQCHIKGSRKNKERFILWIWIFFPVLLLHLNHLDLALHLFIIMDWVLSRLLTWTNLLTTSGLPILVSPKFSMLKADNFSWRVLDAFSKYVSECCTKHTINKLRKVPNITPDFNVLQRSLIKVILGNYSSSHKICRRFVSFGPFY